MEKRDKMVDLRKRIEQERIAIKKERAEIRALYSGEKKINLIKAKSIPNKKRAEKKMKTKKSIKKGRTKSVKKSPSKKTNISKKETVGSDPLKQVLLELGKELRLLKTQKRSLEKKLEGISKQIASGQDKELRLREKISDLMKRESSLGNKKASAKDKLVALVKKIEKVSSVGRQLKE